MTILGRSEELVSRCVECDLAEPESLASLGGSAPGVVDGILSPLLCTPSGPDVVEEATTFNHFTTPTYNPNGEMDKADMETNATAEEVEENTNMNNMNDHLGDEGMETQTHT